MLGYVASRGAAMAAGVRFDADLLTNGWPLLDLPWLRNDLLGSLWHLHSQPPLHNLVTGLITLAAPGREAGVFYALHLGLGLLVTVVLLDLLRRVGVRPWLAVTATLLAVASPAAIVWEHNLSYTWPITVTLVVTAWAVVRFGERPSTARAVAISLLAGLPVLTWSLFHFGFVVVLAAGLALVARTDAKRLLAAAAIPVVLAAGFHVKNLVLFGDPAISTWAGQNFFRVVSGAVEDAELQQLVRSGDVHPIALVRTFSPLADYAGLIELGSPTGRPELDSERKASGSNNYNHRAYIEVSHAYFDAATDLLRAMPSAYPRAVLTGMCIYAKPSSDYWSAHENRDALGAYTRLYWMLVYGLPGEPPEESGCRVRLAAQGEFAFLLPVLLLAAFGGSVWLATRRDRSHAVRLVAVFAAVALGWVAAVGNLAELGENNRFRFVTEPLMWVPLALLVESALGRRRGRALDAAELVESPPGPGLGPARRTTGG